MRPYHGNSRRRCSAWSPYNKGRGAVRLGRRLCGQEYGNRGGGRAATVSILGYGGLWSMSVQTEEEAGCKPPAPASAASYPPEAGKPKQRERQTEFHRRVAEGAKRSALGGPKASLCAPSAFFASLRLLVSERGY